MRMNLGKGLWLSALAAGVLSAQAGLVVTSDRSTARYHVGETAKFVVRVTPDAAVAPSGEVSVAVFDAGERKVVSRTVPYAGAATFDVPVGMDRPSFWRCSAETACATNAAVKVKGAWGVGCDPERIRAVAPRPDDFDAYWDGEVARLAHEVPLDAKMTPRVQHDAEPGFDYYDVSFATFGQKRVYGILSVPSDRSKAPFRVRVRVPGAGPGWTSIGGEHTNTVSLLMNVFPFPTQRTDAEQKRLYAELNRSCEEKYGVGHYMDAGISVSREEYFFHDIILGINRSVDWIAEQPFADRGDIVYVHGSQGGAFGYFLMGLNRHFRRGVMYVTAMCDHLAEDAGRRSGWPRLVHAQKTPEGRAAAHRFAPYFDSVNFAPRIRVPVLSVAGFIDQTCPPATVWAAYNALGSQEKRMIDGLGMGHPLLPHLYRTLSDWLDEK